MRLKKKMLKTISTALSLCLAVSLSANAYAMEIGDPSDEPGVNWGDLVASEYDIIVDGSIEADKPEENLYKTVQAAYSAASEGTADNPTVIGIKPAVYYMNGSTEGVGLEIFKDYITLKGMSDNAEDVVLADNRGLNAGATNNYNSSTIASNATGFTMENITILNYCNIDYKYNDEITLEKRTATETQAFAYCGGGDKHYYNNCQFISLLDTTSNTATRSLYNNCYIQGTNDFINSGGTQVYYNSTIKALASYIIGGGIENAVFINTEFIAQKDGASNISLCKGETPIALINCTVPTTNLLQYMNTAPQQKKLQYYNLKTADGGTGQVVGSDICGLELTAEQAESYNIWNLLRGNDDWDPMGVKAEYADKGDMVFAVRVSPASAELTTGGSSASFRATIYPTRLSDTVEWSAEGDVEIVANGNNVTVSSTNASRENTAATIKAAAANGIYEVANIICVPKIEEAPRFITVPTVKIENGVASVSYEIELAGRTDTSVISWYRADNANGDNKVLIADTKYDTPCRSYNLTTGELGKYMFVSVAPKHDLSEQGEAVWASCESVVSESDVLSTTIETDFFTVPTHPPFITDAELNALDSDGVALKTKLVESVPGTVKGKWNFIGNWWYNYGVDNAAEVMGIMNGSNKCSRLIYSQLDGEYGNMEAVLELYPEKKKGQGFGSANQYLDVMIKYDPETQNGYGVRIERTPKSAEAVDVTLYRYNNGAGEAISESVLSGHYKGKCVLTLSVKGNTLSANMTSSATEGEVNLSAEIEKNTYGGLGIYHTGTISAGNRTVIRYAKLSYPEESEDGLLKGDFNNDKVLMAADAASILQYVLSGTPEVSEEIKKNIDVDDSGVINAADAAGVLQKVLNSEYSL